MSISISKIAVATAVGALLMVPALPANFLPDILFTPGGRALPVLVDGGAKIANEFLVSAAIADEDVTPAIDFDSLVYIDEQPFEVSHDESISTEVISARTVRKIGYGRETHVQLTQTLSGRYSTDGLASPHVLYPGITVKRAKSALPSPIAALFWQSGLGWIPMPTEGANSFFSFGSGKNGSRYVVSGNRHCASDRNYVTCG